MSIEVTVGPPLITISRGSTFVLAEPNSCITPYTQQGFYCSDTRYVSSYEMFADGKRWILRNSSAIAYYASRAYLTNPKIIGEQGEIPANALSFIFSRAIENGIHEDIDITNYSMKPIRFLFEISLRTDFADIFEVKDNRVVRKGNITTQWNQERSELISTYEHEDFRRRLTSGLYSSGSVAKYSNGRISFLLNLAPMGAWHTCVHHVANKPALRATGIHCVHLLRRPDSAVETELRQWNDAATSITSSNEDIYRLFKQSVEDTSALRLPRDEVQQEVIPAAGVPWFVAVFGRDSLIVSLQNMIVYPDFARGVLDILGRLQATEVDDYRDAQPGKILHELRVGELAERKLIPHTPYYGTADATALYLIALHEAWKWLGDDGLFRQHEDAAKKCLEWIDRYGDLDGDGLQEYQTRSEHGYENMGWKDAADSVMYPDGTPVEGPKALCELQGYTYDAWCRMAQLFEYFSQPDLAATLRQKAEALRQKFENLFWCEETGSYAYALDGHKNQVTTIASNPGHLLWSGIASRERASRVVARLMESDMWSGWGIRSLSEKNPAFNPFSYQNGSIWPHDNGIIAMGFKRYGFVEEAARIARDISEAASFFAFYRLPELYAGTRREPGSFPIQYLGANVPQAWAAGSVFHLLRAILGLDADARRNTLYVDPVLPEWLPDITLHNLSVGTARVTLRFSRESRGTRFEVLSATNGLRVEWAPSLQIGAR